MLRIVRLDGALAIIAVEADNGGCGRCDEPGGCRSALLAQMFHQPNCEFSVPNLIGARVGDRVLLRLPVGSLARLSLTIYLVPVFAVLVGAAVGVFCVGDVDARDTGAICGSLVGLAACWLAFRLVPTAVGMGPQMVRDLDGAPNRKRGEMS
ncbi:MAG: SoxR reducing system RseC family protein [Sterolibacteriaceae bacterium]|nr:SoxR reducing system RseC family protein [Candidatus Methylophosphatis haderslevensis]